MEHALKCNDVKCRAELREQALVTTCSHIFCVDCGNRTGLTGASRDLRVCPACQTHLPRLDDATLANLNPSEDYKTSVLSGLTPEAIMECAGRGLSFWSYQMVQDLTWESHRCRVLTTRYNELNTALDRVINEANTQITALHSKAASMALDQETLRRKNEELSTAYKEKSRKLLQMQELYDKLKRKAMLGHIQDAASDAVETTLQGSVTAGPQKHPLDYVEYEGNHEQQFGIPHGASRYADRLDQTAPMPAQPRVAPPSLQNGGWSRPAPPLCDVPSTPSSHRQRLGDGATGVSAIPGLVAGTPGGLRGEGRMRQPLGEIGQNQRPNVDVLTRAGLSSHLKTGQGPGLISAGFVPTSRPRIAQRPGVPLFGAGPKM